jgi:hypothetical protein
MELSTHLLLHQFQRLFPLIPILILSSCVTSLTLENFWYSSSSRVSWFSLTRIVLDGIDVNELE